MELKTKSTIQSTVQIPKLESESKFRHLPITYKKWEPGTCKIADSYYSPTGYPFLVQNCRQDILFWHTRHHHNIILTCTSVRPHCVLHMCEGLRLRKFGSVEEILILVTYKNTLMHYPKHREVFESLGGNL